MVFKIVRKRTLTLLVGVFCAMVAARLFYRVHYNAEPLLFAQVGLVSPQAAAEAVGDEFGVGGDLGAYNFARMTQLVEVAKRFKVETSCSFDGNVRRHTVNRDQVQALCDELVREQASLQAHIWELKGQAACGIPVRKYRSLMYYLEVLDHTLVEMRALISGLSAV